MFGRIDVVAGVVDNNNNNKYKIIQRKKKQYSIRGNEAKREMRNVAILLLTR